MPLPTFPPSLGSSIFKRAALDSSVQWHHIENGMLEREMSQNTDHTRGHTHARTDTPGPLWNAAHRHTRGESGSQTVRLETERGRIAIVESSLSHAGDRRATATLAHLVGRRVLFALAPLAFGPSRIKFAQCCNEIFYNKKHTLLNTNNTELQLYL